MTMRAPLSVLVALMLILMAIAASGPLGRVSAAPGTPTGTCPGATGTFSFVGGGNGNCASNTYTVATGGNSNTASNLGAAIGGGHSNLASGMYSTISAGYEGEASGNYSTVGGGE